MNKKINYQAYRREWLINMYATIKKFLIVKKKEETITEKEEAQAQEDLKFLIANLSMYYYSKDIKRNLDMVEILNENRNLLTIADLEYVKEKAYKRIDEDSVVIMVNAIDFDTEWSKEMKTSENYQSLVSNAMVRLKDLIYKSANQEE